MIDVPYIDVYEIQELPTPEDGYRFFDFIGGTKELRCYLVPKELPRGTFIKKHEDILDPCIAPIYKNHGLCVRQDPSYPLPGFYIISPEEHYRYMDYMDSILHLRLCFIIQQVRKGMREVLNIDYVHLYYEEKSNISCNVHYWLLPIIDIEKYPRIYSFNLLDYLNQFKFKNEKDKILDFNDKMRSFLKNENTQEKDKQIRNIKI